MITDNSSGREIGRNELPSIVLIEIYDSLLIEVVREIYEFGFYSDKYILELGILGEELEARCITNSLVPVPIGKMRDGRLSVRYEVFPAKLEEKHFEHICSEVSNNSN
jgi:hypothetical protein